MHSSTWRGLVDKIILVEGALSFSLHSAGYARPALGNVAACSHLPRLWSSDHPLRPTTCSQTCQRPPGPSVPRARTPRRSFTARWCAIWAPSRHRLCCTAVDGCCCARIRRSFARCRPSLGVIFGAIESASRAARRDVQLAAHGARGEDRGRDARAIGWACRGTCFFILVHSHRDHIRLRE